MNGDLVPLGAGQGRQHASHLHRRPGGIWFGIFRSAGADNVRWVWTPNVDGGGQYPFRRFYPGDRWVDWVGLDGFNWAKRGEWQSFTDLFGSSYETLSRISSRPMIVAETGSSQSGGDKAAWVSSALRREIAAVLQGPGGRLVQRPGRRRRLSGQQLVGALRAFRSGSPRPSTA